MLHIIQKIHTGNFRNPNESCGNQCKDDSRRRLFRGFVPKICKKDYLQCNSTPELEKRRKN